MSSAEFHQPIELAALRRIAEPKKGPSIRVRRRRYIAGLAFAGVAVTGVAIVDAVGNGNSNSQKPACSPVEYVVQQGDTVWNIAQRHNPNGDPRPLVRDIIKDNGLGRDAVIVSGKKLNVAAPC